MAGAIFAGFSDSVWAQVETMLNGSACTCSHPACDGEGIRQCENGCAWRPLFYRGGCHWELVQPERQIEVPRACVAAPSAGCPGGKLSTTARHRHWQRPAGDLDA